MKLTLAIFWFGLITAIAASCSLAQEQNSTIKVFVLAGQSNMQGHGVVDLDHEEHYNGGKGTLNHFLAHPNDAKRFAHLKNGNDWTVRDDVVVRYKTETETKIGGLTIGFSGYEGKHHIGPEYQFGHVVGDHFDEPVLLIKTAWGGKSLKTDFRPPSAVAANGGEVGPFYVQMLAEVSEALENAPREFPSLKNASFEIAGFAWQQGWNDMIDEDARKQYFQNLVFLINDVRKAWGQPLLPVVVGELGNGGNEVDENMKHFRREQSRIDANPPFVGNVVFVPTSQHARPKEESPNIGHGHHWFGNAESYLMVGDSLGHAMVDLINQPASPRVLILGDSISIGYMPFVQEALGNSAFVARPMANHFAAENCEGTKKAVGSIDRWLSIGGGKWDVIHFNFGLHDLKHVDVTTGKNSNNADDPEQSPPEVYEKNLRQLVAKLKATGAKLIFATTTPVPEGGVRPFRDVKAPQQYNAIARKIMDENNIAINDLYACAANRLDKIQRKVDVHFTPEGSKELGAQVVEQIRGAFEE